MTFASLRRAGGSVLAALAVAAVAGPVRAASYEFIRLPSLGGTSSNALGMDARGNVVGVSTTAAGASRATLWKQGTPVDLGIGDGSTATAINKHGVIVGNGSSRAFRWENGVFQWLSTDDQRLVCCYASASGINDDGVIVGASQTYSVMWTNLTLSFLFPPGLIDWSAGINNQGQVVVVSSQQWTAPPNSLPLAMAMQFDGTSSRVLDSLCGALDITAAYTVVSAINNGGQSTGYCLDDYYHNSPTRGIRWEADGSPTALDNPGASRPYAINAAGNAVGQFSRDGIHWGAALWRGTKFVDLRRYIDPALNAEGWVLTSAHAINAAGMVAGQMENSKTGETAGWVLRPN